MFKPLLAPNDDPLKNKKFFQKLKYPLLCSPKLDGVKAIVKSGVVVSRTLKEIRSYQVQKMFNSYEHYDGELIVGNETDKDVYNRTQSHVMSFDKPHNDLKYRVFDFTDLKYSNMPFEYRFSLLKEDQNVSIVEHKLISDYDELLDFEEKQLLLGYEGIMLRNPKGIYKHNRATFNDNIIYKLKRFSDDEAVVVELKEMMINNNALETDERGYAKRSSSMEGLENGNTLGTIVANYKGELINVAPGVLNKEERKFIWENYETFLGKRFTFRHFAIGVKDKPRFPRFVGWRELD